MHNNTDLSFVVYNSNKKKTLSEMRNGRSKKSQNAESQIITVAFLSTTIMSKEELEEEDDDEEDDNDFDFNPNTLSSKPPSKRFVEMRIIETGYIAKVKCRLPWTWSWLRATIKLKDPPTQRWNSLQQLIAGCFTVLEYQLDTSTGEQVTKIFTIF